MVKEIDFGEQNTVQRRAKQHDSFGLSALLLRYRIATSPRHAAQLSKLLMVTIVIISLLSIVLLRPWSSASTVPDDAYFDPAIHNADDEPL